jgi:VWFA-related protein
VNSLKTVMKYAEEEDVMVYAIGLSPAGFGGGGSGRGGSGFPGRGRGGFGGRRPGSLAPAVDKPDGGLPKIAAATGGGYFELTSANDLASTFARVADELHHQYALGFTPSALDGKMHSLELHVKGEGMKARARKSYFARAIR